LTRVPLYVSVQTTSCLHTVHDNSNISQILPHLTQPNLVSTDLVSSDVIGCEATQFAAVATNHYVGRAAHMEADSESAAEIGQR